MVVEWQSQDSDSRGPAPESMLLTNMLTPSKDGVMEGFYLLFALLDFL